MPASIAGTVRLEGCLGITITKGVTDEMVYIASPFPSNHFSEILGRENVLPPFEVCRHRRQRQPEGEVGGRENNFFFISQQFRNLALATSALDYLRGERF